MDNILLLKLFKFILSSLYYKTIYDPESLKLKKLS